MTISFQTLGRIDLRDAQGEEVRNLLTQSKRLAVLVFLASTATDRLCRRDVLLAMFWPESDAERARAALRQAVHFIRQEIGADVVMTRGVDELGIQPEAISLDAALFERLADERRDDEAIALYQGDFLEGFFVRGAPDFERWVSGERDRLRRRAAECAWRIVEASVAAHDFGKARDMAERAVRLAVDSEIAVRKFIELLARSGDRPAALTVYREFAAGLAKEYGVQPSPETLALVATLSEEPDAPPNAGHASTGAANAERSSATAAAPAAIKPRRVSHAWLGKRTLIAAILVVSVLGVALRRRSWRPAAEMDANRIAVLPFDIHGSPELRYLHDGLPMLLSTRLDGVANLRTVDVRAILLDQSRRGADSLAAGSAIETAEKFGAGLYVIGNVVGSASALRVEAALYDTRDASKPLARVQSQGSEADIVTLMDKLTSQLLADRFRDRGGLVAEMAARTSPSFVALKAWMEGESSLARGRYSPAIASFKAAIQADSTFAMAYYRLAVAAAWAGDLSDVEPSARRAVALADKLPPTARTIVQAFLASRTGRYADAERSERSLLAERPTSIDVWFDLGEVLYHANPARGRPIVEAQEAFEQLLRMDPQSFAAMSHLARLAAARRDATALDSLSRAALSGDPDGTHRAELFLLRALSLGDLQARANFLAMPQTLTQFDALWRAAEYTENLHGVHDVATTMLARATSQEMRASLFLFLAHVALGEENFAQADVYADSLSATMPVTAAITSSLIALHPAATAYRQGLLAIGRIRLNSSATAPVQNRVYAGASRPDIDSLHLAMERALLNLSLGDSTAARKLLADSNLLAGEHTKLKIFTAANDAERRAAVKSLLAIDSLYGNSYAIQTPLAPRAVTALAASDLLEHSGQHADALQRLSTVPEDFGFNIGYLAEVHRRRAKILVAMGKPDAAGKERTLMTKILQ